ncbi:MAG: LysR family transcriptional regulator [Boseongicola sp.]|nr:LysR family transcriptional regulator [Boseongicola sp.]NNJ68404.1 LysR family transcriptional regulator [Boseongicola sp.]
MNWQSVDFDWNQVRAFLATLEEGSLSAAARALGLTQPTLGRQVTALEAHLGVTLFERAGRQLIPTPAALEVADHVRAMGEAATRLSLVASGQSQSVEGTIKITATEIYSAYVLPQFVKTLRSAHPGILIDIVSTNSLSNLRHREADIAIRNAEPTDPDLIARKIKTETGGLFASRAFAEEHGPFQRLDDLADVPLIGFGDTGQYLEALQGKGAPVSIKNVVARSDSHIVHWELARRGLGLGINGWDVGVGMPDMLPVLREVLTFEFPVWLVAPKELKTNRRVRIVFDALAAHLLAHKAETDQLKRRTTIKSA